MYIFDFVKSLFKKEKLGILIWLILNTLMIITLFSGGFRYINGIWIGAAVYLISLMIALSPVGEFILRVQNGCKRIKDPVIKSRLVSLFDEVYSRSMGQDPGLSKRIKLYISDSDAPNAFATGRKTLCITMGLLEFDDDQIKAVLAHEFGHLSNNDTDAVLVVAVGNLIVGILFALIRLFANIFLFIAQIIGGALKGGIGGVIAMIFTLIGQIILNIVLLLAMRIWTQLGVWLCMSSSRKNEYKADAHSVSCGYGRELCQVLAALGSHGSRGLFATLRSSHPKTEKRIKRIEALLREVKQ